MNPQLEAVYDYIKRKNKAITLHIECRMCKTKKHKSEFNCHTHICKECWNDYVKLSKEKQKEVKMKKELAEIKDARFNLQDRGIFVVDIIVYYENGWSQNVCNLCLDTYDEKLKKRVGTKEGLDFIMQLLNLFNCDNLEELKGKYCFILMDEKNKVLGIQTLRKHGSLEFIYADVFKA